MSKPTSTISEQFPQYSFLKQTQEEPYAIHHVFDKNAARHLMLHSFETAGVAAESLEALEFKIKFSKELSHRHLLGYSLVEQQENSLHLCIDDHTLCPLIDMLDGSRLTMQRTLEIAIQVAAVLECLHNNQMTHEGVCAEHIFLDKKYFVKLSPPCLKYAIALCAEKNKGIH